MINTWTSYIVGTALAVSAIGIFIWQRKRRNFIRVGEIAKLYFFPVKSLKAVEVTKGKCTKYGFEVNGLLDRSFMVVNEDGVLVSQRQAPSLVLLSPHISDNYLIITSPNKEPLKVKIQPSPSSTDKMINCKVHTDVVGGIDCGDEAAVWFESYLGMKGVRLVRFFQTETLRKYTKKDPFIKKLNKDHPIGFQDIAALHIVSQPSVDDLNSRIGDKKISALNFRPNILVEDCAPYAEDSWKYIQFKSGAVACNLLLTTRCLLTTNDPDTGVLSQKEPLITLRKYRISEDPLLLKLLGSIPCLGTSCGVLSPGEIAVGDEIFAVLQQQPKMQIKKE